MSRHAAKPTPIPPTRWWGLIFIGAGGAGYITALFCFSVLGAPLLGVACAVGLPAAIVGIAVWYSHTCRIPALREAAEQNTGPAGGLYWTARALLGEPPRRRRR